MADSVVTFLLEYLSGLLKDEANFLHGVKDEVNSLHAELELINIFLKNSEGKRNDEIVKEAVRQIREVASEAEDVIDIFILEVAEFRRRSPVGRIIHIPSYVEKLRNVGRKIACIKDKIIEIYSNSGRYGIEKAEATVDAAEDERLHRLRREVEEDEVVGLADDSTKLVKLLTEGDHKRDVISIIGMGGLGKTTLARKIYNTIRLMNHFECLAWVHVSQDFRTRVVLLQILKQMQKPDKLRRKLEEMSDDDLKKELFEYLEGKRYLVVMDDVWKTEVWDGLRSVFPDNSNRSRILITSRKKKVGSHASLTPPYCLPFLDEDESWALFMKKVFRRESCPPELETLGRQIVEGCQGLPLSIVALAGLLANKEKSLHIWSRFVRHVTSFLTSEEETTICLKILSLSYTDLPRHLKPCFLYLGIYTEDFEIPVRQLMHLWIAEGFIPYNDHRLPEDVAEIYLEELIDRSLIQVASRRTDGGVKTCRVQDSLRELCILESAKEMFLDVHLDYHSVTNKSRRLSIQGNTRRYISLNPSVPKNARSLLFIDQDTYNFDPNHWKWIFENFKLLRVLNFGHENLYSIPTMIEKLIHLRYLAIKSAVLRTIPVSIVNLSNLETLDMRGTFLDCLPEEIWKLRHLRNLYMSGPVSLPDYLDPNITALHNLQVLSTVSLNPQNLSRIVNAKLPNLRKLGIWFGSDESNSGAVDVLECLHRLCHLEKVKVINWSERPLRNLFPSTITKITLRQVCLEDGGGMSELGKLLNLRILKLQSCLLSSKLHVFPGTFPRLRVLKLEQLIIKEWKQEGRAMPCLKHLVIKKCIQLTMLPLELLKSTALRDVEVLWSTPELTEMLEELQKEVGFNLVKFSC